MNSVELPPLRLAAPRHSRESGNPQTSSVILAKTGTSPPREIRHESRALGSEASATLGTVYGRMNRVKDALSRFWTRARDLVKRRGDGREKREKSPGNGVLPRLIPLATALAGSAVVFAILTRCESGAYYFPPFRTSSCETWSQSFGFLSTSAGVGFLIFLMMEVVTMIFAQMWKERQIDRAERREEMAEIARMVEVTERMMEVTERRAEMAEQARREDAERAARMVEVTERMADAAERRAELSEQARREDADRAERRELLLIELIKSLKNGKDDISE